MRLLAANGRGASGLPGFLGICDVTERRKEAWWPASAKSDAGSLIRDERMLRKCTFRVLLESFEILQCFEAFVYFLVVFYSVSHHRS